MMKARKMLKPLPHLTRRIMIKVVMKKSAADLNPRNVQNLGQNPENDQTPDPSRANALGPGQENGRVRVSAPGPDLGHEGGPSHVRAAGLTPAVGGQFHVVGSVLSGAGECLPFAGAADPGGVGQLAVSGQPRGVGRRVTAADHGQAANGRLPRSGQRNG